MEHMFVCNAWKKWRKKSSSLMTAFIASMACASPTFGQATNALDQEIEINAAVSFGLSYFGNTSLLQYVEPTTTKAKFQNSSTVVLSPNTTNNPINLATLFPSLNTALVYGIKDMSQPGQQVNVGMAAGGSRFNMAPGGFFLVRVSGSSPTIYADNPSLTKFAIVQVFSLGN
jgi:hypothetical protein